MIFALPLLLAFQLPSQATALTPAGTATRMRVPWLSVVAPCGSGDPCDPAASASDGSSCAFSEFGATLVAVGDLDGDGKQELAIGAPRADDPTVPIDSDTGAVGVYSSKTGSRIWQRFGPTIGGRFGSSLAVLDDLDHDGLPELIVGAPVGGRFPCTGSTGRALVYSALGAQLFGLVGDDPTDRFGAAVSASGDVDGDGTAEFAVGAPLDDAAGLDAGRVRIYSGANGAPLLSLVGWTPRAHFGAALARLGDVDGDGRDDLAVGAPGASELGAVRVFSGATGTLLWSAHGSSAGDEFASSLARLGDLDNDGRDELLVGVRGANGVGPDAGALFVYSGASGSPLRFIPGLAAGERFGVAVQGLGDLNGDGRPEFAASAPFADFGGVSERGIVRTFDGATGGLRSTLRGAFAGDRFGAALARAGDYDGNGKANELWVGVPLADGLQDGAFACPQFTDSGAASVWSP